LGTVAAAGPDQTDEAVLADFSRRVQAYEALHLRVEGRVPAVQRSSDPGEIRHAIDALGNALREARRDARQGDIFTPDAAAVFRRYIREHCRSDFRALLELTHEDLDPMPRPQVNGRWPGEAVTYMPPSLLCSLPDLPDGLQYRFVNRDLVLWDSRADLIVDVLPDAIPPLTES
jgi:hypothetical protein